jgi:hypothetical protein
MDERLLQAGIELGDMHAIKIALQRKGYRASLGLYGPHTRVELQCEKGGRGISCTHRWTTTPMEALSEDGGCPHCKLEDYIENGPAPEVTEAEMAEAIKVQHKRITDGRLASRNSQSRSASNYGLERYI